MKYDFADGKYSIVDNDGDLTALRNGEPWDRVIVGDNLVYWMLVKVAEQGAEIMRLRADSDFDHLEYKRLRDELQALSVTNILLDVVPGDGSGHEVYAKSTDDVVNKLTELGTKLEDTEGDLVTLKRTLRRTEETCVDMDVHALALHDNDLLKAALREITELHGHWTNGVWAANVAHTALGGTGPAKPPQRGLGDVEVVLKQARTALLLAEPYVGPNTIANNKLYDALGDIDTILKATT